MINLKNIIQTYSKSVSNHPYIVLAITLLITGLALLGASNIQTESMDYKDMLPDNLEVITALDYINDQYGGSDSATIAIELVPNYKNSDEPRDVRDPKVISYINILSEMLLHVDDVTRVTSSSTLLKNLNGGILPKDLNKIVNLTKDNGLFDNYVSKDYSMTLIRISLSEDFDEDEIIADLNKLIKELPVPSGLKVSLAGQTLTMPIVKALLGPDMARTSMVSLIGIVVLLLLLFRSVRFGLTPLATIGIGIIWAFGFIGMIGMGMNSATSGVISMIMGIGIDFGIQIVTRFRRELKTAVPEKAMNNSLNAVFMPMAITTLAALIGFRAMSWGELTMMGEMGNMMSFGITACFLVAITIVPAILIIGERLFNKKLRKQDEQKLLKEEKKLVTEEKMLFGKLFYKRSFSKKKQKFEGGKQK